ncbi:proteasome assembly chaperone family protein [Halobaculum limi]|uniref:proteasome assembly chaperone family protein n=1 Tax=Halobaculum limi TaxID=3031916 RepID=UPI0024051A5B|nr:PAC2 family protein [Halobaculum sp. YSMS11]
MHDQRDQPAFHVTTNVDPSSTVIAGFSQFGLAGLTAVDYLVNQLDLEATGYIRAEGLPTITPFANGEPRYPTRLFSRPDLDVTVLVGELFVPNSLAEPFSRSVLEWTETAGVQEVTVLSGVPFAHGPDEHRAFYVASEDYRHRHADRLDTTDADGAAVLPPMGTGFLDGTNGALMTRAMESSLGVGVFLTPVHARVPDAEASVRLVDAVEHVYGLGVDTDPLEAFAEEVGEYYRTLADRLEEEAEEEQPADRMYM